MTGMPPRRIFVGIGAASARTQSPDGLSALTACGRACPGATKIRPCSIGGVAPIARGAARASRPRIGDVALRERRPRDAAGHLVGEVPSALGLKQTVFPYRNGGPR
jgi:hypothetical protein